MEEIRSYSQLEEVAKQELGNKFEQMAFSEKHKDKIVIHLKNIEKEFWYEDIEACRYALLGAFAKEWVDIDVDYDSAQITISSPKIKAYSIMQSFEPYVIKTETKDNYTSILIGDKNSSYQTWVDRNDSDGSWDWNKSIFCLSQSNDVVEREMQHNESVYFAVDSLMGGILHDIH